jgi:hypothetical protein
VEREYYSGLIEEFVDSSVEMVLSKLADKTKNAGASTLAEDKRKAPPEISLDGGALY